MTETIEFMPFLSIITVTKDNLKGLRATHSSITQQSSSDYEWIVVDGASNDQTVEFLQEIKADYTIEPDKSLFDAMNKGITRAREAYKLFLNAGDTFADSLTIEHLVKAATNSKFSRLQLRYKICESGRLCLRIIHRINLLHRLQSRPMHVRSRR